VYPRNAASPPRLSIGPVVQISDGAVQTAGVSVKVIPQGGTESAGAGTVAYSADGAVLYTPTQGETDYVAVVFVASKTGCIPASVTVVTTASATAGYAGVDWSKLTAATSTVNLSGTTISTSQAVASVSGAVGSVTGNVSGSVSSITGVTFPAHFDNLDIAANGHVTATVDAINNNAITASSIQANAITAAKIATDAIGAAQLAADAVTEIQSGLATAANLLIAIDRVSYCLSALAGNCSDAQTAAETYVLSIGGNTYTVDYSGLDASGNRGTTTLTKA